MSLSFVVSLSLYLILIHSEILWDGNNINDWSSSNVMFDTNALCFNSMDCFIINRDGKMDRMESYNATGYTNITINFYLNDNSNQRSDDCCRINYSLDNTENWILLMEYCESTGTPISASILINDATNNDGVNIQFINVGNIDGPNELCFFDEVSLTGNRITDSPTKGLD